MLTSDQDKWLDLAVHALGVSVDNGQEEGQQPKVKFLAKNRDQMIEEGRQEEYLKLGGDKALLLKIQEAWEPQQRQLGNQLREEQRELEREEEYQRESRDVKKQEKFLLKHDEFLQEWGEKLQQEFMKLPPNRNPDEEPPEEVKLILSNIEFIEDKLYQRKIEIKSEAVDLTRRIERHPRDNRKTIEELKDKIDLDPCPTEKDLERLSFDQKMHLLKFPKQFRKFLGR